jgi:chromosome segregation ATPase
MPFEIVPPEETAPGQECRAADEPSRQLALFRADTGDITVTRTKPSLTNVQQHIAQLGGQIETLRQQLRGHSADRLALLLGEMIEERERELERWIAQEQAWDARVNALEAAIAERDEFRRREALLLRERDTARAAAEAVAARLEAAERAAEAARRKATALERSVGEAKAEQLRLREERALDETNWHGERRRLAAEMERLKGGWLGRLLKS